MWYVKLTEEYCERLIPQEEDSAKSGVGEFHCLVCDPRRVAAVAEYLGRLDSNQKSTNDKKPDKEYRRPDPDDLHSACLVGRRLWCHAR
jgi:hypothetical protein